MMMKIKKWTVAMALLTACGGVGEMSPDAMVDADADAGAVEAGTFERVMMVGELERRYMIVIPEGIAEGDTVPLVFDFHPNTEDGDLYRLLAGSRWSLLGAEHRFVLVVPKGKLGGTWGWQDTEASIAFFDAMLEEVRGAYPIDDARVYATGVSSGAIFSHYLACVRPEHFAAVLPIAGNFRFGCEATSTPVAMRHYHGTEDSIPHDHVRDVVLSAWAGHNGCGAAEAPVDASHLARRLIDDMPWTLTRWPDCDLGADVEFVSMVGHAHSAGGIDYPAAWAFLDAHPKR